MNNPYRSGTADVWYSGKCSDLWAEYKYLDKLPVRAEILPDLSPLQKEWLEDRYRENRQVLVIVGHPGGGVIYQDLSWTVPLSPDEFLNRSRTRQELARWIYEKTTGEALEATVRSRPRRNRRPPSGVRG